MSVPGFTADSAVYRTNGHYRTTSGGGLAARRSTVTPQGLCVPECRGACMRACQNPWSARCKACMGDCMAGCDI